jgi:hypothetical protein
MYLMRDDPGIRPPRSAPKVNHYVAAEHQTGDRGATTFNI